MKELLKKPNFIDFNKEHNTRDVIMECLKEIKGNDPFRSIKVKVKQYNMVIYKSRTLHEAFFKLKEPWISIPLSLILIGKDNMAVNGVLY
jgi:hypothetical protein